MPGVAIGHGPGQDRTGAHRASIRVGLKVTQCPEYRVEPFGERFEDAADRRCIADQNLGPHARVAGRDARDIANPLS